ncbi:MAG: peptidyl-prolyl cis-trans isomerase [Methyloceanibacter sp.]|jgi:hypothetical protein|nr:peptidyl-prolyl cis-trans isomerase [Methyloceanibacter sp.]
MTFIARLIREPLVQFLLIGVAIFAIYDLVASQSEPPRDRIVVTEGRAQQLALVFAKTWQRSPSPQEMRGLIDAYVKEEIYYREAIKLGLDRDDTLIRRRMQQKMEFLSEPSDDRLAASDATLQSFYDANQADFLIEPEVEFQQILIDSEKDREPAEVRAEQLLRQLRDSSQDVDASELGDATLLPYATRLSSVTRIGNAFGENFAKKLATLPAGEWTGPIKSPFGLHLVHITDRRDERLPPLNEIRKAVEQKWRTQERDQFQQDEYDRLRANYEVVAPLNETAAGSGAE